MKIILVDDELEALIHLEEILTNFNYVNIIGKFTNSRYAQKDILLEKPDVVFLDIQMPVINGIDLAKTIKKHHPNIHVIFTTAHDSYAIEAFELNAKDYILKPFNFIRVKNALERISISKKPNNNTKNTPSLPVIRTFQALAISSDFSEDKSLNIKWRTKNVKGVFMFLLQHRGKFILKDSLLELFWQKFELKKGYVQLYNTIYHIRNTLKSIDSDIQIVSFENSYKLKLNKTKLDIDEWENWLRRLPYITHENIDLHREILNLYKGDYLENEEYIWIENERERLKALWIEHTLQVAEYLASTNQVSEAISLYLRLQSTQPYIDISYYKLMILYSNIGDVKSVESQYDKLQEILLSEHGLEPRDTIKQWYENWREKQAN